MDVATQNNQAWREDHERRRSELDLGSRAVGILARRIALIEGVLLIFGAIVIAAVTGAGWQVLSGGGLLTAGVTLVRLATLAQEGPDPPPI